MLHCSGSCIYSEAAIVQDVPDETVEVTSDDKA